MAYSADVMQRDPFLQKRVDFWVKVYGIYGKNNYIIHDSFYVEKVYAVLDLKRFNEEQRQRAINEKINHIAASLQRLAKGGGIRNELDGTIYKLFNDETGVSKYRNAIDRIRVQRGLREDFKEAVIRAGTYLPITENVFTILKLPTELARLVYVESMFNVKAVSKAGAVGLWQFMKSTGQKYLKINSMVDERRDPFMATVAAGKLLKENYNELGNWPLAVTAYNHGLNGVKNGTKAVSSKSLSDIIRGYKSKMFGFASSNFYTEFLAALYVDKNYKIFFGDLDRLPALDYEVVEIPHFVSIDSITYFCGLTLNEIKSFNPALNSSVYTVYGYLPKGIRLRIPQGKSSEFIEGYIQIPSYEKRS